jgi:hypothetical protein
VTDLLEGLIKMTDQTNALNWLINLGSPNEFTMLEFAKKPQHDPNQR